MNKSLEIRTIFGWLATGGAMALLVGCGIRTGLDPIDNISAPRHACERKFTVANNSSVSINIHMTLSQEVMDADCEGGGQDVQSNTVPAGQTAAVATDLNCRTCEVVEAYSVDATSPAVTFTGYHSEVTGGNGDDQTATCTDKGCSGT